MTAEYDIILVPSQHVLKNLSHANPQIRHYQWICLLPAVDVAGKHKTIQFTVTCVMITIVQKIVILRSMLDHGRSFSCRLSSYFPSVIARRSCSYNKYLRSYGRNLVYIFLLMTHWGYTTFLFITSSTHQQLILSTKRESMSVLYISPRALRNRSNFRQNRSTP